MSVNEIIIKLTEILRNDPDNRLMDYIIIETLDQLLDETSFFQLPLSFFLRICQEIRNFSPMNARKLLSNLYEQYNSKSLLLLDIISISPNNYQNASFVLSGLTKCPLCTSLKADIDIDYLTMVEQLKKEKNELEYQFHRWSQSIASYCTPPSYESNLDIACKKGDLLSIIYNIQENPYNINKTFNELDDKKEFDKEYSLLYIAAFYGHHSIVDFLLLKGADINKIVWSNGTSLHLALENSHLSVIEILISKGADINANGYFGRTPLHFAIIKSNKSIIKSLLLKGVDINARDQFYMTPLHMAVIHDRLSIVKLLLSAGADINKSDWRSRTPIHYAIEKDSIPFVEVLYFQGEMNNAKGIEGKILLDFAKDGDHFSIVAFLTSKGVQSH